MRSFAICMFNFERSGLGEYRRRAASVAFNGSGAGRLAVFLNSPISCIATILIGSAFQGHLIANLGAGSFPGIAAHIARSSSATAKHSTKHGANVSKRRAGFNGQRCALGNIARCNNVNAIGVRDKGGGGFLTSNVYKHAIQLTDRIGHNREFEIFIGGNRDLRGGQAHEFIGAVGLLDRSVFQHKRNIVFSFRLGSSRLRRALVVYRGILFHGIFHSRSLFLTGSARSRCHRRLISRRLGNSPLVGSRNRSSLVSSSQSHCDRIVCRLFRGLSLFSLRDFGLRRFIARESLRWVHRRPTEAQQHYRKHY